jgi:hypothetical protein
MFANRAHRAVERDLIDALSESGRQVALHGWTGVGKTSLLDHVCETEEIEYIQVECSGSYEEVMHAALSDLDVRASTRVVETTKRDAELRGGAAPFFTGKLRRGGSSEEHYKRYSAPLETIVVDALAEAGVRVLFLDNLEDLVNDEEEHRKIGRLMKKCSRRSKELGHNAPKIVLAGPTTSIDSLLLLDQAVNRRTLKIEVPRMPPEEIEQILFKGGEKLGIRFDDPCREQIVVHADGFPYYAHLYALHCSQIAINDRRDVVRLSDFYAALDRILDSCAGTLKESYSRSIRGRGQPAIRQGVLAALASGEEFEIAQDKVLRAFLALHPHYERVERVRFIAKQLKEYRDELAILEQAWLDDGTPAYRFRDPLLRVYIRLRTLRDRRDTQAAWTSSLPIPPGTDTS